MSLHGGVGGGWSCCCLVGLIVVVVVVVRQHVNDFLLVVVGRLEDRRILVGRDNLTNGVFRDNVNIHLTSLDGFGCAGVGTNQMGDCLRNPGANLGSVLLEQTFKFAAEHGQAPSDTKDHARQIAAADIACHDGSDRHDCVLDVGWMFRTRKHER